MNQRNVDALAVLMTEYLENLDAYYASSAYVPLPAKEEAVRVAEFLANRGVLVPSVLTDEQAKNGNAFGVREVGWDSGTWYEMDREQMVSALERIAQGDTV